MTIITCTALFNLPARPPITISYFIIIYDSLKNVVRFMFCKIVSLELHSSRIYCSTTDHALLSQACYCWTSGISGKACYKWRWLKHIEVNLGSSCTSVCNRTIQKWEVFSTELTVGCTLRWVILVILVCASCASLG